MRRFSSSRWESLQTRKPDISLMRDLVQILEISLYVFIPKYSQISWYPQMSKFIHRSLDISSDIKMYTYMIYPKISWYLVTNIWSILHNFGLSSYPLTGIAQHSTSTLVTKKIHCIYITQQQQHQREKLFHSILLWIILNHRDNKRNIHYFLSSRKERSPVGEEKIKTCIEVHSGRCFIILLFEINCSSERWSNESISEWKARAEECFTYSASCFVHFSSARL